MRRGRRGELSKGEWPPWAHALTLTSLHSAHSLTRSLSRICNHDDAWLDRTARNSHYIRGVGGGSNDSVRVELVELPLVQVSQETEGPCFRTVKASAGGSGGGRMRWGRCRGVRDVP